MVTDVDDFIALERRRGELRMSRAILARRANIPLPTVTRLLTGRVRDPRLRTLKAIAHALGVSLCLGREDDLSSEELREQQAAKKARLLVGAVQASMALESQAVGQAELESMVRETVHRLLGGSRRCLWED